MRHYQICKPMSGLDDFIKAADIFWMLGVWLYLLNLIDVYRWEKKVVLAGRTKVCLFLGSAFPVKLFHANQQLVEQTSPQDGFEIDSLTVSCQNCTWGVTFNASKDRSLKAVSSEHLQCPKTVTAPLGARNS